jgi:hypothetical protein
MVGGAIPGVQDERKVKRPLVMWALNLTPRVRLAGRPNGRAPNGERAPLPFPTWGPDHRMREAARWHPSSQVSYRLLVAGFSDRSNSPVRCKNGGFPCRIWAPTVRRDKINRCNCLKRNFVDVRVGRSHSSVSVPTQNVFRPVQAITEKVGHFSAYRPNSSGQRNPQPVEEHLSEKRFVMRPTAEAPIRCFLW